MKYLDEFRDPELARALIARVKDAASRIDRTVRVMEICGGHTVAFCKYGIHAVLPENVRLISGPGCPVCVTPGNVIDEALWLASQPDVMVFTFGDMLRVPGSRGTLHDAAHSGKGVRMIYSPLQATEYAAVNPGQTCVLLGVGFETTAPVLAAAILAAEEQQLQNFCYRPAGKLTPPAMRALLDDETTAIDGFIAPGHVTTVIGADAYRFIGEEYEKPCVVSGFELCDVLDALCRVLEQLAGDRHHVEIQYTRSVTMEGNRKAQKVLEDVFCIIDDTWRGLGIIPLSGYGLSKRYSRYDTAGRFDMPDFAEYEPPGCRCGDVLRGVCIPPECPLFGTGCTPDHAIGPCMVSSEGSCAAYYKYGVQL
jgi:hydrogenase expression/formation protein HypD